MRKRKILIILLAFHFFGNSCLFFFGDFLEYDSKEEKGFPLGPYHIYKMQENPSSVCNLKFSTYQILQANQNYNLEGMHFGRDEKFIHLGTIRDVFSIIESNLPEPIKFLIFENFYESMLRHNYLALYVDRNIKLVLEVLQENCRIVLNYRSSCRDGKSTSDNHYQKFKHGTIEVRSSTKPIGEDEYYLNETILPFYALVEVDSFWEYGTAPKNCKFKITTQVLRP